MAALPADLAEHVDASLRTDFDNDTPAQDYIWFNSGSGDNPNKVRIIQAVRAYLSRCGGHADDGGAKG